MRLWSCDRSTVSGDTVLRLFSLFRMRAMVQRDLLRDARTRRLQFWPPEAMVVLISGIRADFQNARRNFRLPPATTPENPKVATG